MQDWNIPTLVEDVRPLIARMVEADRRFALATIARAVGGPRPVGTQMLITADAAWGHLSGGCIESDVALHARAVLDNGRPQWLVYGEGSPFIDMRLPCGGRIEVLVEAVDPDDPAIASLLDCWSARVPAHWLSDGNRRECSRDEIAGHDEADVARMTFRPTQRLAVVGADPFALSMARFGQAMGWGTTLIAPFGPEGDAPFDLSCVRGPAAEAVADLDPDRWTAIAFATHEIEREEAALATALASKAGYIGLLGSRRRLPERLERLRALGVPETALSGLHAPIGLSIGASTPREVAAAVVAEIIAARAD